MRDLKLYLSEKKWFIILFLAAFSFVLGYIGFYYSFPLDSQGNSPTPTDLAYLSLQLFVLCSGANVFHPHWALDAARFLAPITTLIAAILIVVLVFYNNFLYAYLRLLVRDHTIICGMGYVGPVIARNLLDREKAPGRTGRTGLVIIEKDPLNPSLEECRRLGAIVIEGDATREYFLKRANVLQARSLYCVTGEDDLNAQVALTARKLYERGGSGKLTCFLHIVDSRMINLLQIGQMAAGTGSNVRFEFVNIYENAGRCLIDTLPFYREGAIPPDRPVHLVILDLGRMGETVLVHAVKRWKEHGFLEKTGSKVRISFIDREAGRKSRLLQTRYPSLATYCTLVPLQMDTESAEFLAGDYLLDESGRIDVSYLFICSDDSSRAFSAALTLSDLLKRQRDAHPHLLGDYSTPVWIRTAEQKGFAGLFDDLNRNSPDYRDLKIFPLISCSCCIDLVLNGTGEQLARAVHSRYLENRYLEGEKPGARPALQPWGSLPPELQENNRRQAASIFASLNREGFMIVMRTDWDEPVFRFTREGPDSEVERLARLEHENWINALKESPAGPVKEPHRCLYAWDKPELPEDCRERTREAVQTWPELLAMIDMNIIRRYRP